VSVLTCFFRRFHFLLEEKTGTMRISTLGAVVLAAATYAAVQNPAVTAAPNLAEASAYQSDDCSDLPYSEQGSCYASEYSGGGGGGK
jgi:hypothetical protein